MAPAASTLRSWNSAVSPGYKYSCKFSPLGCVNSPLYLVNHFPSNKTALEGVFFEAGVDICIRHHLSVVQNETGPNHLLADGKAKGIKWLREEERANTLRILRQSCLINCGVVRAIRLVDLIDATCLHSSKTATLLWDWLPREFILHWYEIYPCPRTPLTAGLYYWNLQQRPSQQLNRVFINPKGSGELPKSGWIRHIYNYNVNIRGTHD